MFPKVETLIGGINNNSIPIETVFFKEIEYSANTFVYGSNAGKVILKITLVLKRTTSSGKS